MKSFNTKINNISNPIGFDLEVSSMQAAIAKCGWMESLFGVAHVQMRYKSEGESETMARIGYRGSLRYEHTYPQGIGIAGSLYDLTFDSSYASRGFFLMHDKQDVSPKFEKWDWVNLEVSIAQPFSFIFHANLKSLEQESSERLKTDILWAFNSMPKIIGVDMSENMDEVWKEFTITPEINGITRYPYYCLRVNAICNYTAFPYNGNSNGYQPNF